MARLQPPGLEGGWWWGVDAGGARWPKGGAQPTGRMDVNWSCKGWIEQLLPLRGALHAMNLRQRVSVCTP